MSAPTARDEILAELTPQSLRALVRRLARQQPRNTRETVSLHVMAEALCAGCSLGEGSEGWQAPLRLQEAIRRALERVLDMPMSREMNA